MSTAPNPWSTSIGRKLFMAISGVFLLLFVVMHLAGNLQIFLGREALNHYAHLLRTLPEVLWTFRIGLIVIVLGHLCIAWQLRGMNQRARTQRYYHETTVHASLASRVMLVTGTLLFLYVLFHLAHFTFGWVEPEHFGGTDGNGLPDVYGMVVHAFQNPILAGVYILAMLFIGFHLVHATSSFLKTLGLSNPFWNPVIERVALVVTVLIILGYISIPVAVLAGLVS